MINEKVQAKQYKPTRKENTKNEKTEKTIHGIFTYSLHMEPSGLARHCKFCS